jgi:hypothetical protein
MQMRKASSALGLAIAATLVLPAAALATTSAAITVGLSPNKLGAGTKVNFTVTSTNSTGGMPAPSQQAVIHLPGGLKIDTDGFPVCTKATLDSKGPTGCPKGAQVGGGSSVLVAQLGPQTITENATVQAFVGGKGKLELYANGQTPISQQLTLEGTLGPDSAPYGQQLVVLIPPIPTVPGGPNASIQTFSTSIGASRKATKKKGKKAALAAKKKKKAKSTTVNLVTAPSKCPAGGFKWGGDFTYSDGASSVTAISPCP